MIHSQIIDILDSELVEKSFEQLAQQARVSHVWPRMLRRKLPASVAKLESLMTALGYELVLIKIAKPEAEPEPAE
jgi:hypothetical protein